MAYMSRLGIWGLGTQFATFQDFIKSVERRYQMTLCKGNLIYSVNNRGVGAMELVAMDMKVGKVITRHCYMLFL